MNTMGRHNDVTLPPYMFINKNKLDKKGMQVQNNIGHASPCI